MTGERAGSGQRPRRGGGLFAGLAVLLLAAGGYFVFRPGPAGSQAPGVEGPVPAAERSPLGAPETAPAAARGGGARGAAGKPRRERAPGRTRLRGRVRGPGFIPPALGKVVLRKDLRPPEAGAGMRALLELSTDPSRAENVKALFARGPRAAEAALSHAGAFVFVDPPPGRYELELAHPFLRFAEPLSVTLRAGADLDLGVLEAVAAGALQVFVAGPLGRPIEGAEVRARPVPDFGAFMDPAKLKELPRLLRSFEPLKARTDARGYAEFLGLAPGKGWFVEAQAEGYAEASRRARLVAGRRTRLELRLSLEARLRARVRDERGAPLAGARLVFARPGPVGAAALAGPRPPGAAAERRRVEVTGSDGTVLVRGLPPGLLRFRVEARGHRSLDAQVEVTAGRTREVELTLARGAVVAGVVVDAEGAPIEGALVADIGPLATKVMGFDTASMMPEKLLAAAAQARGVRSGADGSFELGGFEDGEEVHLFVSAKGHTSARPAPVRAGTRGLRIVLEPACRLRGRVLLAGTKEPAEQAVVRVLRKVWLVVELPIARVRLAAADGGRFEFESLPRGSARLAVEVPGRATLERDLVLEPGLTDLGDLFVEPPAAVEGFVRDPRGRPIAGARVRRARGGAADNPTLRSLFGGGGPEARTDGAGRFRLAGLPAGRIKLLAEKEGYAPARSRIVRLRPGETTAGVTIVLSRGGRIVGRVVDAAGRPLAGWHVEAKTIDGSVSRSEKTGADGSFRLAALKPGRYIVTAFPKDFVASMARMGAGPPKRGELDRRIRSVLGRIAQAKNVPVRDGEDTELVLTYKGDAARGGTRLVGTVTLAGAPLAKGWVELRRAGVSSPWLAEVEDGRFDFGPVPPGDYELRAKRGLFGALLGHAVAVHVPKAERHALRIRLPGGVLAGHVRLEGGGAPSSVLVGIVAGEAPPFENLAAQLGDGIVLAGSDGSFRFEGLAAGRYTIHAREFDLRGGGRSGILSGIRLAEGEVREDLVVTLAEGARLEVLVRGPQGPIAGALVQVLDASGRPIDLFHRGVTGRDGTWSAAHLAPGRYRVAADARDSAPATTGPIEVAGSEERRVEIELRRGVPVFLEWSGTKPLPKTGEPVHFVLQGAGGTLLREGIYPMPPAPGGGRPAVVPLGRLEAGRYRLALSAGGLGRLELEREVRGPGPVRWRP